MELGMAVTATVLMLLSVLVVWLLAEIKLLLRAVLLHLVEIRDLLKARPIRYNSMEEMGKLSPEARKLAEEKLEAMTDAGRPCLQKPPQKDWTPQDQTLLKSPPDSSDAS